MKYEGLLEGLENVSARDEDGELVGQVAFGTAIDSPATLDNVLETVDEALEEPVAAREEPFSNDPDYDLAKANRHRVDECDQFYPR